MSFKIEKNDFNEPYVDIYCDYCDRYLEPDEKYYSWWDFPHLCPECLLSFHSPSSVAELKQRLENGIKIRNEVVQYASDI